MIYLAEVKKQNKGFIGGVTSELKLLACQRNDQTWSMIPGEEIISCESLERSGEGALLLINLGENRKVQGKPEPAGPKLVRWLQTLTNQADKTSSEWEKIEQWKQSLTYQSQELSRREMEIEARVEQLEQMEQEFERLDSRRQDLEAGWEENPFGPGESGAGTQQKASSPAGNASLISALGNPQVFREKLMQGLAAIDLIQNQFRNSALTSRHQLLKSLEQALQQQELLLQRIETLPGHSVVDIEGLENQPLGELEATVETLKADLDKRMGFVSDQEEELTLQSQAVAELKEQLKQASEYERLSLEGELADEQERKRMLDETLVGQRRTLREQQAVYRQYLQVLNRRQGKDVSTDELSGINLEPVLLELKEQHQQTLEEHQALFAEIQSLQAAQAEGQSSTSILGPQAEEFQTALNQIHQQFEAIESLLEQGSVAQDPSVSEEMIA